MANAKVPAIGGFASLGKKLLITFGLLCVYRVGIYIPVPGTDLYALAEFIDTLKDTVFGLFNMFSGGALERLSVLTLGIVPYISASIVMQLLQVLVPSLQQLSKEEGSSGKRKISQYTRYLTLVLTFIQGYGIAVGLESMTSPNGTAIVLEPGLSFRLVTSLTLCAGTMFVMWIGERISEYGIGNGISLIIFAGIVTGLPRALVQLFTLYNADTLGIITVLGLIIFIALVVLGVVFFERALRKVPIHYAKRQVGAKVYGGESTHLPLKLNIAGVIPPIFASSLLLFPATLETFSDMPWLQEIARFFSPSTVLYNVVFVLLI
ncbi:MAG: preprotein translocase subunit SecY, partial [Desulfovibrionaceae bacterium]|nr:preprotein translocase subunit SecY [Desulfovibrionaceae bacterium]